MYLKWCKILKKVDIIYKKDKAKKILKIRNIDLEEVKNLLKSCKFEIIDKNHSPYEHQHFVVLIYHNYPIEVIFYYDEEKQQITIITAFPNRNYKILIK